MTDLKLYNSLSRSVDRFVPVHPGQARVYSCGPTVYNYPHIGNLRAYIFADTLSRVLSYKGYRLTHVINITDVGHMTDDADAGEDKVEKAAAEKGRSIWEIARHYTQAFWEDVRALNIREPSHWAFATEYVPMMIEFARKIAVRHCYELDTGLYFDVTTVPSYGALAGSSPDKGEARIDPVDGKRHPADFAIWRKTRPGEVRQMEWVSPWGRGAPGWHLECSTMSAALLGLPFDIHTGGIDHREIHHPNEIAQNQAYGQCANSGARIWMHNNFLVEHSCKMSKSGGEFLRLEALLKRGYHPLAYRLFCLQAHYRSPLHFDWDNMSAARKRLKRLVLAVEPLRVAASAEAIVDSELKRRMEQFETVICNDLNTPIALTILEDVVRLERVASGERQLALTRMDGVLGLNLTSLTRTDLRIQPEGSPMSEEEIETALCARQEARMRRDYTRADAIRRTLLKAGVDVMDDDRLGWDWRL